MAATTMLQSCGYRLHEMTALVFGAKQSFRTERDLA